MGWLSPTGNNDASSTWTSETLAYDTDTGTYAYTSVPKNGWSGYLELTIDAISCDKVQGWFNEGVANVSNFELDVYYSSGWHTIQSGEPVYGQYVEFAIGSTEIVTAMRFRFYSTKLGADGGQCYEAQFNEVTGVEYYGILKSYNGAAWVKEPLKTYLAASWQEKPLKRYAGAEWVTVDTTGV